MLGESEALLADGSEAAFNVYGVSVRWDGQPRYVETGAVGLSPLLGMAMLDGYDLNIPGQERRSSPHSTNPITAPLLSPPAKRGTRPTLSFSPREAGEMPKAEGGRHPTTTQSSPSIPPQPDNPAANPR